MTSKGMPHLIMMRMSVPRIKVCSNSTNTHFGGRVLTKTDWEA